MTWVAVAVAGAAVVGGVVSSNNANKAASAQQNAANTSAQTQADMYNQTRADQTPWRTAGGQAVDALSKFYGLGGINQSTQAQPMDYNSWAAQQLPLNQGMTVGPNGEIQQRIAGAAPDQAGYQQYLAGFPQQSGTDYNSILANQPGYQFQLQQGQSAVERNLAARGLLNSGAAGKALTQYGQGMASQYTDKYVNGLQSLAGLGQTSVGQTGQAGAAAANGISNAAAYGGNAAAAGYANQANAINTGLSGVVGAYGMYQQNYANTYGANSSLGAGNINAGNLNTLYGSNWQPMGGP